MSTFGIFSLQMFVQITRVLYPPKGVCERRSPEGVHFSKLIQERNLTHQFQELISAFLKSEKCFIWWVGGWVGCDILPSSIFLIFKYDNKQRVLLQSMVLKVAYAF